MGNNHLSPTKKKAKITKEIFIIIIDKDKDKAKTLLQQVSISFLRGKKNISSISNVSIAKRRAVLPISVFRKKTRIQKTNINLGNVYASNCS